MDTNLRHADGLSIEVHRPYLLAMAYFLVATLVVQLSFFTPPPRFMDIYLIGIALFCARWSVGPALLIYVCSIFASALMLPVKGSLVISEGHDVYRMVSYSVTSWIVIGVIERLKGR